MSGLLLCARPGEPPREVQEMLDRAYRSWVEGKTAEQIRDEWQEFKCGGCTLRGACPTSPVCPASED